MGSDNEQAAAAEAAAAEAAAAEAAAAEAAAAEAAAAEAAKDATKPNVEATTSVVLVAVKAVRNDFYNPFTKTFFKQGVRVEAILDGWLQSQIDAGYVVRV